MGRQHKGMPAQSLKLDRENGKGHIELLYPDGHIDIAPLEQGKNGFCTFKLPGCAVCETEVPNLMLEPVMKKPAARKSMRKPAASTMRKPAACPPVPAVATIDQGEEDAEEEKQSDPDECTEPEGIEDHTSTAAPPAKKQKKEDRSMYGTSFFLYT